MIYTALATEGNEGHLKVLDLETSQSQIVHRGGIFGRYAASGHLLYWREGTVFAAPFDQDTLQMKALPAPVLQGVAGNSSVGSAQYDVSENGTLIYLEGDAQSEGELQRILVWADRAGEAFGLSEVGRGLARGDVDNDGDVDVLVINNGGPPRLLLNQVGSLGQWLGARPVSGGPASDALGARVTVRRRGGAPLRRRVQTDGSYSSAGDPRLLFGLGAPGTARRLGAVWPDGSKAVWNDPPEGRVAVLAKGRGRAGS